jgi:hypothetical protein
LITRMIESMSQSSTINNDKTYVLLRASTRTSRYTCDSSPRHCKPRPKRHRIAV